MISLDTILMIDHWEQPSDVCCLKLAVLNFSIYHRFLKALPYIGGNHPVSSEDLIKFNDAAQ